MKSNLPMLQPKMELVPGNEDFADHLYLIKKPPLTPAVFLLIDRMPFPDPGGADLIPIFFTKPSRPQIRSALFECANHGACIRIELSHERED